MENRGRRVGAAAEAAPLEGVLLKRLTALIRAQFMADPEAVCALISSQQPNLSRVAPLGLMVTLAPGATTTITQEIPEGFVYVLTRMEVYTDVPFAVQAVMFRDGVVWYVDPGIVPVGSPFRTWQPAAYRAEVLLINTSALNVNVHLSTGGWELETATFRHIMAVLAPLSYALSEHGTPEGAAE